LNESNLRNYFLIFFNELRSVHDTLRDNQSVDLTAVVLVVG